jgi:hypothetical protein
VNPVLARVAEVLGACPQEADWGPLQLTDAADPAAFYANPATGHAQWSPPVLEQPVRGAARGAQI